MGTSDADYEDGIGDDIDEVFALHDIVQKQGEHIVSLARALRFYAKGGSDEGRKARAVFNRLNMKVS